MIILGLKNCDTCRKAQRALEAAGAAVVLRDVRETPLSETEVAALLDRFGEALINRRSTTWRGLDAAEQALPATVLLARYPALMKRPVIQDGETWTLGWTSEVQAQWLGGT